MSVSRGVVKLLWRSGGLVVLVCLLGGWAGAGEEAVTEAAASTLDGAILAARDEVRAQRVALTEVRRRLSGQRQALSGRLETLTHHVAALRSEVALLDTVRREGAAAVALLEQRKQEYDESCGFIRLAGREYRRGVSMRAGQAAATYAEGRFEPLDARLDTGSGAEGLAELVEDLLDEAEAWNRRQFGGVHLAGQVVDEAGMMHEGELLCVGPQSWFAAPGEAGPAGLVFTRTGAVSSGLHETEGKVREAVREAVSGGAAVVPMDVSGGDAFRMVAANPTLAEQWRSGGFVMYPLALVALFALLLTVAKSFSLARMSVDPVFPEGVGLPVVEQLRKRARAPLAPLLDEALAHRDAPRPHLEELMSEAVSAQIPRFERHLGTLAVLGGVAPLLGLLGTVTGMIHTFQLVNSLGTGNARLLSGGISEALITTKFGLAIAIPILLIHAFLARRTRVKLSKLELSAARIVNQVCPRTVVGRDEAES